jgi:hypothetical protein
VRTRNVILALAGAAALVLKGSYGGPMQRVVHAYGGNVVVSFALYFACLNATRAFRRPAAGAAILTLGAVSLFEATNGFGVTANTYDPLDFVANAAGVGLAVVVDRLSRRVAGLDPVR